MSEVISLREKVAQAELAARFLNLPIDEREEMAEPPQKVTRQKSTSSDCREAAFAAIFLFGGRASQKTAKVIHPPNG